MPGEVPPVRMLEGLFYAAVGTAIALVVFVFIMRVIGTHGGAIGATTEAAAAHLTGLNA